MLLGALASCLVHTYLIQATLMQLPLDHVEVEVQGALDMAGVVGLPYDGSAPTGDRDLYGTRDLVGCTRSHRTDACRRGRNLPGAQHPAPANAGHKAAGRLKQALRAPVNEHFAGLSVSINTICAPLPSCRNRGHLIRLQP